jgi:hypothetical protein
MIIFPLLIWNLLVPAVVSATVILLARRLGGTGPASRRWRWGVAVGLGLGYLLGQFGILGWPDFPPIGATDRVFWLVLLGIVLGVIEVSWMLSGWVTWSIRGFFGLLLIASLLVSRVENRWSVTEATVWFSAVWAAVMLSWWNLEAQAARLSGPGWLIPLGLISSGWAIAQLLAGSPLLGQLEGVLASVLLGALTTVGLRPGLALSKGGPVIALTILAGLALTGYFEFKLPGPVVSLLCLAPWAPWIDRIGVIRRRSYWTRASIRFLAVLLMVGLALVLADARSDRLLEVHTNF